QRAPRGAGRIPPRGATQRSPEPPKTRQRLTAAGRPPPRPHLPRPHLAARPRADADPRPDAEARTNAKPRNAAQRSGQSINGANVGRKRPNPRGSVRRGVLTRPKPAPTSKRAVRKGRLPEAVRGPGMGRGRAARTRFP